MIEIAIAEDFARAGVRVGLGCLEGAVAADPDAAGLDAAIAEATAKVEARLEETRAQDLPAVAAARRAYKALGKDPARYRPAAEALLRRIAQKKGLYRVGPLVDAGNLVSLMTGFSIGTYDRDRLAPPVIFRRGQAGESYEGIGRGLLNLEGLPVFADAEGPFGSPTSDSARTGVAAATRRFLMVLIGFASQDGEGALVEEADLERAASLLARHAVAEGLEARLVRSG